jgi:RimJ/RimL family protein N-acetyltransferase
MLETDRLDLRPLPAAAAAVPPDDRETAARILGAAIPASWPQADLLDVLPMQASAGDAERYGIWVMIERATNAVIGDIGFLGPPSEGVVEIGFSVVPERRRLGFASEATAAIVDWALHEPDVDAIVARCEGGNIASIRVLDGAGFVRTGELNDVLHWRRPAAAGTG